MLARLNSPLPPATSPVLAASTSDELFERLTPAERIVAAHVRQGLSNKEIAQALGKAPCTVKAQVATILHKYGVPSRARLLAHWLTEDKTRVQSS